MCAPAAESPQNTWSFGGVSIKIGTKPTSGGKAFRFSPLAFGMAFTVADLPATDYGS